MNAGVLDYKNPILALTLCGGITLMVVIYCSELRAIAMASYRSASANYNSTIKKAYKTANDVEFSNTEGIHFKRLADEGKLGFVDRITWVNVFESIDRRMDYLDIAYEMDPAELFLGPPVYAGFLADVRRVKISLTLGFRHDRDLYEFFTYLYNELHAGFEIASLDVQRKDVTSEPDAGSSQQATHALTARCKIFWYTVIPKDSKEA